MIRADLSLVRGDDQDVGLSLAQPDGSAYNLSGCAFTFTARQDTYFSAPILTKIVTDHLDPVAGLSQLFFVPADTASLDDLTHYFDIKLTSAAGKISTLCYGDFTVKPK